MTDAKSAVRAALTELIEAHEKGTSKPWSAIDDYIMTPEGGIDSNFDSDDRKVICLARNLAPRMARGILKMLDEPDCFKCHGMGEIDEFPDLKFENHQIVPCPRCAARWAEWAGWLGVA